MASFHLIRPDLLITLAYLSSVPRPRVNAKKFSSRVLSRGNYCVVEIPVRVLVNRTLSINCKLEKGEQMRAKRTHSNTNRQMPRRLPPRQKRTSTNETISLKGSARNVALPSPLSKEHRHSDAPIGTFELSNTGE